MTNPTVAPAAAATAAAAARWVLSDVDTFEADDSLEATEVEEAAAADAAEAEVGVSSSKSSSLNHISSSSSSCLGSRLKRPCLKMETLEKNNVFIASTATFFKCMLTFLEEPEIVLFACLVVARTFAAGL